MNCFLTLRWFSINHMTPMLMLVPEISGLILRWPYQCHLVHHLFFSKIPHYNLINATKAIKPYKKQHNRNHASYSFLLFGVLGLLNTICCSGFAVCFNVLCLLMYWGIVLEIVMSLILFNQFSDSLYFVFTCLLFVLCFGGL